ncbi:MAG: asparagine--tRNA ligase [Nanoarchaeota archaeon]|nr:asparagine--tRNA ligase [Nanoarchaeota archaeon]
MVAKKSSSQEFLSIQDAMLQGSGMVKLRGWIHRERGSNVRKFVVLRDSSNIMQCVIEKDKIAEKEWLAINKALRESSVELSGEIKKDDRAPTGFEIQVTSVRVISFSDVFPLKEDTSDETLLDMRHLALRSRKSIAILKIRSTVFGAIHEYFRSHGYFEYQSPILCPSKGEGGSDVFEVNYFGKPIYLAQTWQLYAEAGIFGLEKIYTIAPSFRAEKHDTARHLAEYWHAEMECAWLDLDGLINTAEGLVKHITKTVLEKNAEELKILERDVSKLEPVLKKKFARLTYDEALKLLKDKAGMVVPWGKDLRTLEEAKLSEFFDTPVFVTNYPKEIKAFYMKENVENPKTVNCFDLLGSEKFGELIGASEREVDGAKIRERLLKAGEKLENYEFYLDTRRYGSVPHAGFGLGTERVIMWLCGVTNIKEVIPFPRTMNRSRP